MTIRPVLGKTFMTVLFVLAFVWLVEGVKDSFAPTFDLRGLFAVLMISSMILILAIACVTHFRALRIIGALFGVLLAFREYLMLAEANSPLREILRDPGGWIGPALLVLFLIASGIALIGNSHRSKAPNS